MSRSGLPQSMSLRASPVPASVHASVHEGTLDTARLRWHSYL